MFKKKYLFLTTSVFLTIFSPFALISCADSSEVKELKKLVDNSTDVVVSLENINETRTEKIIETLLNNSFRDQAKKVEFVKTQQSDEHKAEFFKKAEEFKQQFTKATAEERVEIVKNMQQLYNDNWYIILKNINKFKPTFYEWLTFPAKKLGKHSDEYLNSLYGTPLKEDSNLQTIDASTINYVNNYIDEIYQGEESKEHTDSDVYYLTKGLTIFRISIANVKQNNPKIHFFPYVWAFSESKSRKISARYISNITHNALIHGYQAGFDEFEINMVKKLRYGRPSKMVLLLKGDKDDK